MTLPKENLDNKAFGDLLKEAISRIPVYAPEWTDHNVHDPGITFIELFAWLTEMQIYRLNRINDKSYRKFLKLMGIPKLKPASAAQVDVTFSLIPNVTQEDMPVNVPAGTIVAATDSITGEDILFRTEHDLKVLNTEVKALFNKARADNFYIDNTNANDNESLYCFAFRSDKPQAGDELFIGFKDDPGTEITLAYYIQDNESFKKGDSPALVSSGTLIWEYYDANGTPGTNGWKIIDKSKIEDNTRNLTISGTIGINIDTKMKAADINGAKDLFWLKCRVKEAGYVIPLKIKRVRLNTIPAIQAIHYKETKFSSIGLPNFYIDLKPAPVLDQTLLDNLEKSKITLTVDYPDTKINKKWAEVEDFDASKPGDEHYTVDLASGRVTFGNGINGKIPPKGIKNIIISYYSGGGVSGNVREGTIKKILSEGLLDKVTVKNLNAASGGEEAETLEEAIQRARQELKEVTRAVTSADYEYLALNTPGVQVARVKALPRYHPSQNRDVQGIISVIVIQSEPEKISSPDFLKAVYWHLDEYRLLTTELFVLPPVYVDISIKAEVIVKSKSYPDTVQNGVKDKLKEFLHPCSGGFDGKGWPFGRPVYLSEIYKVIAGVDGVDYVEKVSLGGVIEKKISIGGKFETKKVDISSTPAGDIEIPAEGLVCFSKIDFIHEEET